MSTTLIKERPILFSGAMVRALLAGTKTQTRRVVKWPSKSPTHHISINESEHGPIPAWCPYGQPGDRLWVRETFNTDDGFWYYRADYNGIKPRIESRIESDWKPPHWKPSIFMPRAASRILLEITAGRCERLQDISEADAVAEGVNMRQPAYYEFGALMSIGTHNAGIELFCKVLGARAQYAFLWNGINGSGAWEVNPWVWVVEFKVIDGKEAVGA